MDSLPPYGVPAASMNSVMLAEWADPCIIRTGLTCLTASSTLPDSCSLVFRENGLGRVMISVSGTRHRIITEQICDSYTQVEALSALLKKIKEQARALSAEDRASPAESMLESLHTSITEIEAAQSKEVEERVSAFDRAEIPPYSAEEVFAEAHRTLQ